MPASGTSWKSAGAGGVPDKFPAGLRVLVVDDDPTCLMIIEKMLKKCNYEAVICNRAETGLSLLRENKNQCDIVLSDVHMPDMDGFKLLEHIGLEMDLPVIMMSADDSSDVVMKGVTHGACDYIIKPVRIEALRNIWQHVVRRQHHKWKDLDPITRANDVDQRRKNVLEDVDYISSANEAHKWKNTKRTKDDEDESEERDESSSKKPRIVWTVDLHEQFVAAVNQLGVDKAVPKKILELMNVPSISRENISSHLQKYRMYLKRLSESRHQGTVDTSFTGILDPGYDLRALTVSGQSLGTVYGCSNNSRSLFPTRVIDQRNTFSFENPRFGRHLLHGVPTNMEPNQFLSLYQSNHHSFNGFNGHVLIPMAGQSHSQNQHVFSNRMLAHGLGSDVSNYMLNGPNQIPDSGSQNITFTDLSSRSSPNRMGATTSIAVDCESGSHRDGTGPNQHDLLTTILEQPQDSFDGFASFDLPGST